LIQLSKIMRRERNTKKLGLLSPGYKRSRSIFDSGVRCSDLRIEAAYQYESVFARNVVTVWWHDRYTVPA
jgi:hypothetical protein